MTQGGISPFTQSVCQRGRPGHRRKMAESRLSVEDSALESWIELATSSGKIGNSGDHIPSVGLQPCLLLSALCSRLFALCSLLYVRTVSSRYIAAHPKM